MVIDLIQVMYMVDVQLLFGSVVQVCEMVVYLMCFVKMCGVVIVMVGYVIKDGLLVGFKVLEYCIDCLVFLDGDVDFCFCILCSYKNCFGVVNELGVFVMIEQGLCEVSNFLVIFLSCGDEVIFGSFVMVVWEGMCLLLVEIQVLVDYLMMVNLCCVVVGLE